LNSELVQEAASSATPKIKYDEMVFILIIIIVIVMNYPLRH
jgi:hypothetical protein